MYKDQSLDGPVNDAGDISFVDFLMDTKSDAENRQI